jgi:hypothetical protein
MANRHHASKIAFIFHCEYSQARVSLSQLASPCEAVGTLIELAQGPNLLRHFRSLDRIHNDYPHVSPRSVVFDDRAFRRLPCSLLSLRSI